MTDHVALRDALAHVLARHDLIAGPDTYERVRERILDAGATEFEHLRAVAGEELSIVLDTNDVPLSRRDIERILGFGRSLTAFLSVPVSMSTENWRAVRRLGARANTLVSVFDQFVDRGYHPDDVLSKWGLRLAGVRRRAVDWAYSRLVSPRERALYRLVADYFRRLASLPFASQRGGVKRTLHDHITEMYRAERQSAIGADGARVNRTTSMFPLVVMGLPSWLAAPSFDRSRYETHLTWLRRVGEFFGLIDDAVDVREDATEGAYNVIEARRAIQSDSAVVEQIAEKGIRIMETWTTLTDSTTCDATLEDVFTTTVASWLGGPVSDTHSVTSR